MPTLPHLRIVIVDDDPQQAQLYDAKLNNRFGTEVEITTFTDSERAAEHLDDHLVDVLITDLRMPHIDGIELIRIANNRSASAQILVMTATSTSDSLVDAAEAGATDYLLKPFSIDVLVELVVEARRRLGRWRSALAATFHQGKPFVHLDC